MPSPRRIVAIVLPRLLSELAAPHDCAPSKSKRPPLGVIVLSPERAAAPPDQRVTPRTPLDAVDETARRLGLREGLSLAEAHAFVASLVVKTVTHSEIHAALTRIADIASAFAPTVELQPPDTVFADITGAAHLAGGEASASEELAARCSQLGHFTRVAVASGPRIAEAVARHSASQLTVVPPGHDALQLRTLPVLALPLNDDLGCWLVRLGVVTVGDLAQLPRAQLAGRLGAHAPDILALIDGHDTRPLRPYDPPCVLREQASWDDGIEHLEGLLFTLKRLTSNLSARLEARGLATNALELRLQLDGSIARLRGREDHLALRIDLPAALHTSEDLLRTLRSHLDRCELLAPAIALQLDAPSLVRAPRLQLDLSRDVTTSPDALPVLLAELSAELGADRVGTLRLDYLHKPEARSTLVPVTNTAPLGKAIVAPAAAHGLGACLTRLLPSPLHLGRCPLSQGRILLGPPGPAFEIDRVLFDARLDGIDWWTPSPVSRDYFHVWLRAGDAGASGWFYVDRRTRELVLHGWHD